MRPIAILGNWFPAVHAGKTTDPLRFK